MGESLCNNLYDRRLRKLRALAGVLLRNPAEFWVRLGVLLDAAFHSNRRPGVHQPGCDLLDAVEWLRVFLGRDVSEILHEEPLKRIEAETAAALKGAASHWAIPLSYSADRTLARLCYLACRVLRPSLVLETGVAYGVTSAHLLAALDANGGGQLISVDLPPLGAAESGHVGLAVPERLRMRWRLEFGSSRKVLQKVAAEREQVGLFVHDSLHTYRNMKWELSFITPYLMPGAVVLCDDAHNNSAFLDWLHHPRVKSGVLVRRGEASGGLIGLSVLHSGGISL